MSEPVLKSDEWECALCKRVFPDDTEHKCGGYYVRKWGLSVNPSGIKIVDVPAHGEGEAMTPWAVMIALADGTFCCGVTYADSWLSAARTVQYTLGANGIKRDLSRAPDVRPILPTSTVLMFAGGPIPPEAKP